MKGLMRGLPRASALLGLLLATSSVAAASPHLRTTSSGYRWERGGFAFDLVHRGRRWSPAEARVVGESLDKLPDVLLRRARTMQVVTFHRDPQAVGLFGPSPTSMATTWIDRGSISFADRLFEGLDEDYIYATVTHELGHVAQYSLVGGSPKSARNRVMALGTPGWSSLSWTSVVSDGLRRWNGFVSEYARTNDREDFAESVEFYWINPAELARVNPAKYRFMRDVVFEGAVSPPETRDPTKQAIASVRPEIHGLSDPGEEAGWRIKVQGEYFMGPQDGGYDVVRFRGTRALHVAVSRQTLWAWVPGIAPGIARVTVATPDGASDAAPFVVLKPWWQVW